jgi:hypothetical protein
MSKLFIAKAEGEEERWFLIELYESFDGPRFRVSISNNSRERIDQHVEQVKELGEPK